jgi:hypothetical protein
MNVAEIARKTVNSHTPFGVVVCHAKNIVKSLNQKRRNRNLHEANFEVSTLG